MWVVGVSEGRLEERTAAAVRTNGLFFFFQKQTVEQGNVCGKRGATTSSYVGCWEGIEGGEAKGTNLELFPGIYFRITWGKPDGGFVR